MNLHKHNYQVRVTRNEKDNTVEIKGELDAKEFAEIVKNTIENFRKDATIQGFRKGSAPEKMIREKIGMEAILTESAESALAHIYPHILMDEKIDAVGRPQVALTKLAEGNPLGFTITASTMPKIKSLDYKKIAVGKNSADVKIEEVTDKDIDEVVKKIKEAHLKKDLKQGETFDEKSAETLALTDELVKVFGDFSSVMDFKTKIKDNLKKEKEYRAMEKKRIALFDSLIEASNITVPKVLVESEQERMLGQFRADVGKMGMKWDDYVKYTKKSETDMKKDWEKDAEKRAKLEIVLDHIAHEEKITPDEKKAETEIGNLLTHYKDLDKDRAKVYVEGILVREAVIEFLEKTK